MTFFDTFAFPAAAPAPTRRTLPDRCGEVINVKDFSSVQAALDCAHANSSASPYGRSVYFPAGQYDLPAPLTLTNATGVHLFGAGRGMSRICATQLSPPNNCILRTNGLRNALIED